MNIILQILINGIIAGSIYALVASGFALIYSTNKFVNFAHGGVIALTAYFLYWLSSSIGLSFYLSIIFTIFFSSFLGYLLNKVFYQPLRNKNSSSSVLLIASIAILTMLESIALFFFGADVRIIDLNLIKVNQGIEIAGAIITPMQIIIISVSILLFFLLHILMKKTKMGKAMRAVADNKNMAEIIGISSEKTYSWSFIVSSMTAGIAAILVALEQNIQPTMGTNLMIKGFTGTIIGGIGNVPGAILGSYLLGIVENLGIWFLPSSYKDAIAFIFLFLFLLIRPQGILGIKNNQK